MGRLEVQEVKHVVMFSGGIGSWAAAKLVAKKHGTRKSLLSIYRC